MLKCLILDTQHSIRDGVNSGLFCSLILSLTKKRNLRASPCLSWRRFEPVSHTVKQFFQSCYYYLWKGIGKGCCRLDSSSQKKQSHQKPQTELCYYLLCKQGLQVLFKHGFFLFRTVLSPYLPKWAIALLSKRVIPLLDSKAGT